MLDKSYLKKIKAQTDAINNTAACTLQDRNAAINSLNQTIEKAQAEQTKRKEAAAACVVAGDQDGYLKEKAAERNAADSVEFAQLRKSEMLVNGIMPLADAMTIKEKTDGVFMSVCPAIDKELQDLRKKAAELLEAWEALNEMGAAMTSFNRDIVNTEQAKGFPSYQEPNTGFPDQYACVYSFVNHGYFEH